MERDKRALGESKFYKKPTEGATKEAYFLSLIPKIESTKIGFLPAVRRHAS